MEHVITIGDVLKASGACLAVIIPIGLVLWFFSSIDLSK